MISDISHADNIKDILISTSDSSKYFPFTEYFLFLIDNLSLYRNKCVSMIPYDSLSVLGTLSGTILVILKIKLFIYLISFNTLWEEETDIFIQKELSIQNESNIGRNYGFIR